MIPRLHLVIGDPIEHSRSPRMHTAGYRALGIEAEFCFSGARVSKETLPEALQAMRRLGVRGAACTMPLKEALVSYVDVISPEAARIGAVNTLSFIDNKIYGDNTDWRGIATPLSKLGAWQRAPALVIGAGGAAAAAIYALQKLGASITLTNRTTSRAQELARRFECNFIPWEERSGQRDTVLIINCSALGMGELSNENPLPDFHFNSNQVVFETIYQPTHTKLLSQAQAAGARTVAGLEMLLHQGMVQFELWTGCKAPEAEMREGLL